VAAAAALLSWAAAAALERAVPDAWTGPEAWAGWTVPLSSVVHNLALSVVLGALVFALLILPGPRDNGRQPHPAFSLLMRIAGVAAVLWVLGGAANLVFSCAETLGSAGAANVHFLGNLAAFVLGTTAGQAWLAVILLSVAVLTLVLASPTTAGLATAAVLTAGAIAPLTLMAHVEGSDNHNADTDTLALHILGASLWVGGSIVLALIARRLTVPDLSGSGGRDEVAAVVRRFSGLVGFAFILVLGAGTAHAALELGDWDGLVSPYGALIGLKAVATLALGAVGLAHRRWAIRRLTRTASSPGPDRGKQGRGPLWWLVTVELLLVGAVSGLAVALSRTPPPTPAVTDAVMSPARLLTGYELPPPLELAGWFTLWRVDWNWLAVVVVAAVLYLRGVSRYNKQGRVWPAHRTLAWLGGLALVAYATCGAPTIYAPVLFSVHTGVQLALAIVVPLLLILAMPLTLLTSTVEPRRDGSMGLLEAATGLNTARVKWLGHPGVSGALLFGSFAAYYLSPAFMLMLDGHIAHELIQGYFLVIGFCFHASVLGRSARTDIHVSTRGLAAAVIAVAFSAWACWLAISPAPIEAGWFTSLGRDWGVGPLTDQRNAALAVWFMAVMPTMLLAAWVGLRRKTTHISVRVGADR
jgi:cytochrome c oxidase assembly factor CtaG/putative copper export protein